MDKKRGSKTIIGLFYPFGSLTLLRNRKILTLLVNETMHVILECLRLKLRNNLLEFENQTCFYCVI